MAVVTLYGTPHQRYVALGNIVYEADGAGRIPDVADNHTADLLLRGCMDEAMWLLVQAAHPAGGISGLTTNKLPRATSSTSIGDSNFSDDGLGLSGTVSIGDGDITLNTDAAFVLVDSGGFINTRDLGNLGLGMRPRVARVRD
jgi:hypothetical protein